MEAILKNKFFVIGGGIVLIISLLVLFAPLLTSYDYGAVDLPNKQLPPGAEHIMGTDLYGRDVWCRIIYGGRVSLTVALGSTAVALVVGTMLGALSGYVRGTLDFVLDRVNDVLMAFPMLLFSLVIGVVLGSSMKNMFLSIGIPIIPMFYRIARATAMSVGGRSYVLAARAMGGGRMRVILRHIIPNVLPHTLVILSSAIGGAILAEASLGFLGFGIPQPTPSWGLIANDGKTYMFSHPWTTAFAGAFIALTILGFNLLGDGLRDWLDPKIRTAAKR
ncbi:MAG: ABC transporter permease [Oscillospiraceae bacterium]|jgi:peptide/nickel transport system permease protein|nr:ABC transporter permease [Oscillospiraceae bacterium]